MIDFNFKTTNKWEVDAKRSKAFSSIQMVGTVSDLWHFAALTFAASFQASP